MNALEQALIDEAFEKIELFKNGTNDISLKVHKLKGKLAHCYSFSVNYHIRIVFCYEKKNEAVLLTIGNHGVYK